MTLEASRALINTGVATIPGINRNGAFISEAPIDGFILFRSGAFANNQAKSFITDFPCSFRTIFISDTTLTPTYTITVVTPEGVTWTFTYSGSLITSIGSTKMINIQHPFVFDKNTKVTFQPSNAISGLMIFANVALNIDIRDF